MSCCGETAQHDGAAAGENDTDAVSEERDAGAGAAPWRRATGIFYALLSSVVMATGHLLIKFAADVSYVQVATTRFAVQYVVALPVMAYSRVDLTRNRRATTMLLLLRGCTGTCVVISMAIAYAEMPLGDATAILYIYPVLVGVFAYCFLKEPYGWWDALFSAVAFVGLIFTARPSFIFGADPARDVTASRHGSRVLGIAAALVAALASSASTTIVRKLGAGVHFSVSVFYFGAVGAAVGLAYLAATGGAAVPCARQALAAFGFASLTCGGQILMVLALQRERANRIALVNTSEVVFSFAWQFAAFGRAPGWRSVVGAALILTGAGGMIARKIWTERGGRDRRRRSN